jgi:hypothetical protein
MTRTIWLLFQSAAIVAGIWVGVIVYNAVAG